MSGDSPVIKFSPFEALLIGEKNKVVKRKPMKNTIFLTHLPHRRKEFDLRELFDVKDEMRDCEGNYKNTKKENIKDIRKKTNLESLIVKEIQRVKNGKMYKKKTQSNKVRFKRDFRFRETLEERIVHKIQKRKKKLKTNIVGNGILSQLTKPNPNRHCLRGRNGKFIRKDEAQSVDSKCLSNYLKHLYVKKSNDMLKTEETANGLLRLKPDPETVLDDMLKTEETANGLLKLKPDPETVTNDMLKTEETANGLPKVKPDPETVLNDISVQYCRNVFPDEFDFPSLPRNMEVTDFDNDNDLMDILYESIKPDEEESNSSESNIHWRRKGLKMYERKRTEKNGIELFKNNTKENHCVNKTSNNVNKNNAVLKLKRNRVKYLIDERPAKSNQLISSNKFRSLFYKTACGSETYLGNPTKALILNSTFGRLTDIS